jgi:hypothetical protein
VAFTKQSAPLDHYTSKMKYGKKSIVAKAGKKTGAKAPVDVLGTKT